MGKLSEIASGRRRDLVPTKRASLATVGVLFAALCAVVFVSEVWTARSVRAGLAQAVGGHSVVLMEVKSGGGAKCGSYSLAGVRGTWLFVKDADRLWAQSALPSQDLPAQVEHEYVACDTYRPTGRYDSGALWFAPQVLAVSNWR
jgi:hypothetical protein